MRILALTTCHNRRDQTLKALGSLLAQTTSPESHIDICVVDDGSSDGTTEAIRAAFPEVVVLRGSGDLFWAGGMRFGWDTYVVNQQFDYLLVFNDDIRLYDGALSTLLHTAAELERQGCMSYAVCGALSLPHSGKVAYGAVVRSSRWHPLRFTKLPPSEHIQECDTMNMNFALISKAALSSIGFLARDFVHARADYDFGLRLCADGGRVVLAPGYVGECNTNPLSRTSAASHLSFSERWRRLTGLKEQPPRERAIYYRRHGGFFWPVLWVGPYIRVFFGSLLKPMSGHRGEQKPNKK